MERKPLILIVEDEKEIAKFIDLELQAENYDTIVTYDGVTGLVSSSSTSCCRCWSVNRLVRATSPGGGGQSNSLRLAIELIGISP